MSKKCCNSTGGQDSSGVIDDKSITEDNVSELFKVTGKTKGNKNFMGFFLDVSLY